MEALGKAFTAKSGVAIDVGKGLGTKARFEALSAGKIDIAMASHGLNVADVTKRGMTVHRIAMTPVLFGVHGSVKIANVTDAQVCSIYAGNVRNWKDLGGTDLAIAPLVRPESEVDMEVVRDGIACFKSLKIVDGAPSLARAGDMAKALTDTTGAIGMTSATFVAQSKGKIKALALNGVAASEDNVIAGKYRLTRELVPGHRQCAVTAGEGLHRFCQGRRRCRRHQGQRRDRGNEIEREPRVRGSRPFVDPSCRAAAPTALRRRRAD